MKNTAKKQKLWAGMTAFILILSALSSALAGCNAGDGSDTTTAPTTTAAPETPAASDATDAPEETTIAPETTAAPETTTTPETKATPETTSFPETTTTPEDTDGPVSVPASFRACSIETSSLGNFGYWLYTPADPAENMPLIVYLHGGSGKGDDLELITAVDGFPKYLRSGELGDVRAYVIIPQLPSSQNGWTNGARAVYELINVTCAKFGINRGNISLTGHSMGGTGTWNLALMYPELFARIAPLSGSIKITPDVVSKLAGTPVRAFVGSADKIVPPESSAEAVNALITAGGDAEIVIFDGADHFSIPALTYLDNSIGIIGWLTSGQ